MAATGKEIEQVAGTSRLAEFGFCPHVPTMRLPWHDQKGNVVGFLERNVQISRFDQHKETSLEIAAGIKKCGGVQELLKNKKLWRKINDNDLKRQQKIANPFGAKYGKEDIEQKAADQDDAKRYMLAAARGLTGHLEGLDIQDLMDVILIFKQNKKMLDSKTFIEAVKIMRGK